MAWSHRPSTTLFKFLHSRTQAGLSLPVLLCLLLFIVSATLLCFLSSPPPPPTPLSIRATSDDPQAGFGWFTGKSGGGVTSASGHLGKSLGRMVNGGDRSAGDAVPSAQSSRAALLSALYTALGEGEEANPLFFLSTGDFGSASPSQKAVAAQMARAANDISPGFVISVGDNVYDAGVRSINDPLFNTVFEDIYSAPSLQRRWYMSLGDHDCRGDVMAQVQHTQRSSKWFMPAPYYSFSIDQPAPTKAAATVVTMEEDGEKVPLVDFIVTNSVGLEGTFALNSSDDRRFFPDYDLNYVGKSAGEKQLVWLEQQLQASKAKWKVVVGHRPIVSAGVRPRFPAESRINAVLKPLLEKYNVDLYLFGHDHVIQHLLVDGITYIGNGVGGFGLHQAGSADGMHFASAAFPGFVVHAVTEKHMAAVFVAANGTIMHSVKVPKNSGAAAATGRPDTSADVTDIEASERAMLRRRLLRA